MEPHHQSCYLIAIVETTDNFFIILYLNCRFIHHSYPVILPVLTRLIAVMFTRRFKTSIIYLIRRSTDLQFN